MGAINYKTSEYITIGVDLPAYDDFYNDTDLIDFAHDQNLDFNDYVSEIINDYVQDDFAICKNILFNYDFYYYNVSIIPGYYEGFTINIENNCYIDCYYDKIDANKEITKIKELLLRYIEYGLVVCYPGWCTSYLTIADSKQAILQAIKAMRNDVRKVVL